ncbi:hypothetical protein [Gracilibacillus alcaliphilus]|uniref:hypothetical protein n=1 Tax=Gracilibacillus alcaliphilus TaxID=1401441 RepID=UPI00195DE125|nr:hypothetical protein [Gracilibacillus alcaliphilus]MBM7679389.1 hypothetical protein [Gracilibacillus alcaliphilus]
MICPICRGKNIGIIGPNQYYCWSCYVELTVHQNMIHLHEIEQDGSLSSLDDLFSADERRIKG